MLRFRLEGGRYREVHCAGAAVLDVGSGSVEVGVVWDSAPLGGQQLAHEALGGSSLVHWDHVSVIR